MFILHRSCKPTQTEVDDRDCDGYEESMREACIKAAVEERSKILRRVRILLSGFGVKILGIILEYME